MLIFVDESGTFTFAEKEDSWCAIAAYVIPESKRKQLDDLMRTFRFKYGNGREVKLGKAGEAAYIELLTKLRSIGGMAVVIAVDLSLHRRDAIERHRQGQVEKIRKNVPHMIYEEGRQAVGQVADELSALPLQLYTQLVLQVELIYTVLTSATLYFVQREPVSLGSFRWRVDQKDKMPTVYESVFKKLLPGFLQTKSLREPMIFISEGDYRSFRRFEYQPGEAPDYLSKVYGLDIDTTGDGNINIGKIINDDFKYVDSEKFAGVQVADLLASGVRRVLRGNFDNVENVALALGSNMLKAVKDRTTIRLLSLDQVSDVSERAAELIKLMNRYARPMIA
ncbi:hypothetical protein LMG24238_03970 [Paraburkholderia sediminicola]|uniref:DUF3800 domain-containing protein n=1 Tax=Paraburkholderia sediminicola TaxID=458836 RepID=A0A6J5BIK7_9BURK|nr:DUF3800 domain-containing protein [Paraburkholderia sediminicola]CAB3707247.1 hypothetical protein LMG24238_03970 [Paraburkholderia sediminicola]